MGLTRWLERHGRPAAQVISRAPVLLVRLLPVWGLPRADGPCLSARQRKMLLDQLDSSSRDLLARIGDLSEAQWRWKPAPDRWSIADVAEHVTRTEQLLLAKVQEALGNSVHADWKRKTAGKTKFLLQVVAPRRGRARAPAAVA